MTDTTREQLETIVGAAAIEGVVSVREIGSRPLREGAVYEVRLDDDSTRIWQLIERRPAALDALGPLARSVAQLSHGSNGGSAAGNLPYVLFRTLLTIHVASLTGIERDNGITPGLSDYRRFWAHLATRGLMAVAIWVFLRDFTRLMGMEVTILAT